MSYFREDNPGNEIEFQTMVFHNWTDFRQLLLDGKCVKIDDLAIFGVGIRSKAAETLEDFSLEKNITGMRLKARATGNLSTTNLKLDSQLKQQAEYQKPTTEGGGSGNTPNPNPGGGGVTPDPSV